jgi:hypothetical protein
MRPGASSLNVAVAAGILIYHFSRPSDEPRTSAERPISFIETI